MKPILILLVFSFAVPVAAQPSLDQAFARASQSAQAHKRNFLQRIVLGSADPAPSRAHSEADSIFLGGRSYFIDSGHVFFFDPVSGKTTYMRDSEKVRAIVVYKDGIIALDVYGDAYLWDAQRRHFHVIGNDVASLYAKGDDLVGVTFKDAPIVYHGEPGAALRWEEQLVSCGGGRGCDTVRWTPYIGKKPLAL